MMSRCTNRFFVVLTLLCVLVDLGHAIYSPREATTKPPKRRESILPWYSPEKVEPEEDLSRSPKWQTEVESPVSRKPYVVDTGTKSWSPWKKKPGSEIEQRTEVTSQSPSNLEQHGGYSLEHSQFEQQSKQTFPSGSRDEVWEQEDKNQKGSEGQILQTGMKDDLDNYEGIPPDSTKPRKEKILLSTKPKLTVALYDIKLGVRCPELDSTGQFVYPPDCKFFVNCWNGRAFVQPCAPGTLFNPDTLECDFPHKVKCYGGEVADFPSNEHLDSSGKREPLLSGSHHRYHENERLQEPKCPPYVTGLLAHPSDCTKFLQCANGGTFVMDCGPGTVFNPAISVCDWPRNVRGCEDALKTEEESTTPVVPADYENFEHETIQYKEHQPAKTISCPADYTGLLPHPETCKKFLQCANGGTFIMDCGPGTAFNPSISVCDWPYNVPSCNEEKSRQSTGSTTTSRPWSSHSSPNSRTWQHQHNHASHNHRRPDYSPTHSKTPSATTSQPATDWDSLRPTWRPSWKPGTFTTVKPPETNWDSPESTWKPSWRPSTWTTATSPHSQTHHRNEHGQWSETQDSDYSQTQWSQNQGPSDQNTDYNDRYNHHHYHHHQHRYPNGQTYGPNGNSETQQAIPPFGHTLTETPDEGPSRGWNSNVHHEHHHYYHGAEDGSYPVPEHPWKSEEVDQQTQQQEHKEVFDYSPNRNDGTVPDNRRFGQESAHNRQEYGRADTAIPQPGIIQVSDGDTYVDRNHQVPVSGGTRFGTQNRTTWTQSVPSGNRFIPDSRSQYGVGQGPNENRRWDQGAVNEDDKLRQWSTRTNIYQSTADREADTKLDHWASKANVFNQGKGQLQPGVKGGSSNSTNSSYPRGIHVNVNGTKGHFITKQIEVNQGHSKTKIYSPNDLQTYNKLTRSEQNVYVDSQTNIDQIPSLVLQPPLYTSNNPSLGSKNFSQSKNISSYGRVPKYNWPNRSSSANSGDLAESGSNYHRVHVPATNLQPPYPPPNRSLEPPFSMIFPTDNVYYPPVPSTNLEPPNYQPPRANRTHPIGWQYPPVPATELQPPYFKPPIPSLDTYNRTSSNATRRPQLNINLQPPDYQPPRASRTSATEGQYPPVPAIELQPPYFKPPRRSLNVLNYTSPASNLQPPNQLTPPRLTPNVTSRYPSVPSSNIEPPYLEMNNRFNDSYYSHESARRKILEEHATVPPKKKILQTTERPELKIVTTTYSNIPTASVENENSSLTEYPDVVGPDLESEVDVLDDEKEWKPVLVFENRTQTTTESSVIMKINKKKVDVDLFNIQAPPFEEEEPPFPAYYIPSVLPLEHSKKAKWPTPISGQVVRLRGGSGPHDGYVEVQGMNPGWGLVCDSRNSWTLKEAHVICRQLGYTRGAEMAWQGRNNRHDIPIWIAANYVSCQGNETRFQSCKFTHEQKCRVERDAIGVRCVLNRVAHCRKDEIPHEGQCYHLADPESGLNHAEALNYCSQRQARLIDITSQAENDFVSEWMLQKHPEVGSIITSGVGFTTMNRTLWLWEDSSRAKFRFTKWWPGWLEDKKHSPFVGSRPLCVVMKRKFPCHERPDSICVADYFFWDTEDCASSMKGHSYICKRPYDDIGCIYGKGSQYAGTANVTASGKDCLSWGDQKVAYPLSVNVLNKEVREKLKVHNYCRNPNPNRESRPWCYTGSGGQKEYCDIPSCGNAGSPKSLLAGHCKPKHFECSPGECIPSPWVCDGDEDCTNGADEKSCVSYMDLFQKYSKHKLEGYDVQKWLNTPLKTCALRCKEADFTCRSFVHSSVGNICLLSDNNVGMTGSLKPNKEYDYYEMKERSMNCDGMFVCNNRKCINQTKVCNGKNDCNDRSDENICTVENLDYDIRLAGAENEHEGRIEVKILGVWGQVCDDSFGMIDADVICKELGFKLGALEVRPGGFYGNMDPPTRFMVDQLKCRGNETSLRECDFEGWGVHNCQPEEAVGVVCKTAVDICQDGHWKCDNSPMCIPTAFICDEVVDCPDRSDESSEHCDAPFEIRLVNGSSRLEGRVEVRHHGIWGTVCDDDFSNAAATVICRSLGYGGPAFAKKDGFFGPGEGPIWLDEVFCYGNETQLYRCDHNHWGQHNCNHDEDAGVICTRGDVNDSKSHWKTVPDVLEMDINDILPANCGRRFKDFNENEELIHEKVVRGTVAPQGSYPWQASIRVRGHGRSNHWCGAVILSPLHVLTAAHCLQGYNKGTYFVRAGDYNTEIVEGTEADANIEDYYIHEDFRKGHRMNNDIALVLLKGRGIPLGKDIIPICLPPEKTEYPEGLNCTISGFGSIETGKSTHSKDLRYGWIPLLSQSECRAGHVYGQGSISDGMVCAGYLEEGIDTCDGDSGGPLACLNNDAFTLYGITSWGQHCGRANKPGVYVRVSHYRQWIDRKIKESLSGR